MKRNRLLAALPVVAALTLTLHTASAADPAVTDDEYPDNVLLFPAPFGALVSHDKHDPQAGAAGSKAGWHIAGGNYRAGPGWWALICDPDEKAACSLHPTRLSVTAATHAVYDGEPVSSQLLHWSPLPANLDTLPTADEKRPLLIAVLKPINRLSDLKLDAGPVTTYVHKGMSQYPSAQRPGTLEVRLALGNGRYADVVPRVRLSARSAEDRMSVPSPDIFAFELRIGQQRQQLPGFSFSPLDEGFGSLRRQDYLVWAGDLDGDGKPDVLLNHGDSGGQALYLSSLAREGELVGLAGEFEYSDPSSAGC